MLSQKILRTTLRRFSQTNRLKVLSAKFRMDEQWAARHESLAKLGLGGDYEWISAVQKKFIGGGHASAVDVDAAVCVAEQKDQVDDVVELVYKLRHSVKAAEQLESSEYAVVRLLLKYQPEIILQMANDPINYGVFLNTHTACLVIDHFLRVGNVPAAARIATWQVQQENLDNELLNVLGLYTCATWSELAKEEQTLPLAESQADDDDVNEDDIRTFKFPYLKNANFDEHFDLTNPHHLVGKSLQWLSRDAQSLPAELRQSANFLGAVLFEKWQEADASGVLPAVKSLVAGKLSAIEDPSEDVKKVLEALGSSESPADSEPLSKQLLAHLQKIQTKEEDALCETQTAHFATWNERRHALARAQAKKVVIRVRQDEIRAEIRELDEVEEQMSFFRNRLSWEKKAAENRQIDEEAAQRNKNAVAV